MTSRFKSPFILVRGAKGFTLIEVMVAITILMLVILPLATLYVKSLTVIQNAALYSQAIQLGQERMEVCQALNYDPLSYYNEVFTPGFPYEEGLPPNYLRDYYGNPMVSVPGNAYDNRDDPDTPVVELYFDPTDSNAEHYPVPVYRDYYNNYTGQCLDPNFDGLCNDDLDGDGGAGDLEDIEIATNGRLLTYTDVYGGSPADTLFGSNYIPGDGLFDTVVEGSYISSMDPMYRKVRVTESPSMILDFALLLDQQHKNAVSDFRYREATYKNFVRMTTFIDPTPSLGNPNFVGTWIDQLYIRDREVLDGYTLPELAKIYLCLDRDLPIRGGMSNYDVGVDEGGLADLDAFNVNYSVPVYGMRIIVTVFYLTGEGEVQMVDIDGDGVVDEERPLETYGGARRIRLEQMFYSTSDITGSGKDYAPPRKYILSGAGGADNPARSLTLPSVVGTGVDSDPCSLDNKGLPYLQ